VTQEVTGHVTEIRRASEDEWRTVREVRLTALQEAPHAFASTYEREAPLDEAAWRRRVRAAAWFVARDGGEPVGIAGAFREKGTTAAERHLIGMWVASAWRRRGVARALCEAVARWAREDGAQVLSLWVAEGNDDARRAYQRFGFVGTGETQPLPSDPSRSEERLTLDLAPPVAG
jgi:GNAT superfamily N-acetyltransferase